MLSFLEDTSFGKIKCDIPKEGFQELQKLVSKKLGQQRSLIYNLIMKYFFLFLFFSLFIALNAKAEFYIESTSTGIVKTDGYDLPNGSKFSILKGTYQWTNSLGYYGTATCKGLLEKENDLSSINFLCESINQKGDKQYSIVKEKSVDLQSGSGKTKIY